MAERKLKDGSILRLQRWVSDIIRPGERTYCQIVLFIDDGGSISFPANYENYSEDQLKEIFSVIKSAADFEKVVKGKGRL